MLEQLTGPWALFVMCVLSGTLVPLPEDVPLIGAGIQIASGTMSWPGAIAAATAGVLIRDLIVYGTGYAMGETLLNRPLVVRLIGAERIAAARTSLVKRGGTAVLVGRLSIGIRAATFLVAGALGLRPRTFLLYDGLGLLVTVPLWIGLGRLFGQPVIDGVLWLNGKVGYGIAAVAVIGAVAYAVSRRSARPLEAEAESS